MRMIVAGLLLGILLTMGCTAKVNASVTLNCGTDVECFNSHLQYCEKALVRFPDTGEPREITEYALKDTFVLENSGAEIVNFEEGKCVVEFTNIGIDMPSEENEGEIEHILVDKMRCNMNTGNPDRKITYDASPIVEDCATQSE